jgi:hypothetical protein
MARILLQDLIELMKASPRYLTEFDGDVPAELSLRIVVAERPLPDGHDPGLTSRILPSGTGTEVVLDVDSEERVWMIEFY